MSDLGEGQAWSLTTKDKLGLALSGGGFRASLFHIGVLARLAELGLLSQVQVLSTVSGGSIIGAYYYLKVKQLLEGRRVDADGRTVEPSRQAYVDIVAEIEVDFLRAVQTNIRTQTLLDPVKNGRMAFSDDYSRSDRIAELYSHHFYRPLWDDEAADPRILLQDLKIRPPGEDVDDIEAYNATSEYKIPILTLNATCLNTGHAWRFTASYVGEFQGRESTIDTSVTLGRLFFDSAHDYPEGERQPVRAPTPQDEEKRRQKLGELTLADAVAASACVPGIFTPLAIHDLFWNSRGEEIVVELVDGGVFDNQGLDAVLAPPKGQTRCTHLICSDASGQIEDLRAPPTRALAVVGRAQDLLMTRVRAEVFQELHSDGRTFAFFHLREVVPEAPFYPPLPGPADQSDPRRMDGIVYRLSNLRTDLDSFTDIEAYALMYHGYCLSDLRLTPASGGLRAAEGGPWRFTRIRPLILADRDRLSTHLSVGSHKLFKIFRLNDPVAWLFGAFAGLIGALFAQLAYGVLVAIPPAVAAGAFELAVLLVLAAWLATKLENTAIGKRLLDRIRQYRRGESWYLTTLPAILFGWIGSAVALAQLRILDPRFLQAGAVHDEPPPSKRASPSTPTAGATGV